VQSGNIDQTVTLADATGPAVVGYIAAPCGPADIASAGGTPGADSRLDNNDVVLFIDWFFNADPRADYGGTGGQPGADGAFDNNDFVVFVDRFFDGC